MSISASYCDLSRYRTLTTSVRSDCPVGLAEFGILAIVCKVSAAYHVRSLRQSHLLISLSCQILDWPAEEVEDDAVEADMVEVAIKCRTEKLSSVQKQKRNYYPSYLRRQTVATPKSKFDWSGRGVSEDRIGSMQLASRKGQSRAAFRGQLSYTAQIAASVSQVLD